MVASLRAMAVKLVRLARPPRDPPHRFGGGRNRHGPVSRAPAVPGCAFGETTMQIRLERSALLGALERVRSVVEARSTIPILSMARLEVSGSTLTISTTDLDMEATAVATTNDFDTRDGVWAVPASTLYEVVRKLPEGVDVSLTYDGTDPRLLVKAGRSKINLPVLPGGDFPNMAVDGLSKEILIASADLAALLDSTSFGMSTEETRYYLNGVYLHTTVNKRGDPVLRAVATDGHRMAMAETALPAGLEGMAGVIIPRKTVREVKRMLDGTETISFRSSPSKIAFKTPAGAQLVSKVIDGAFPDYARVIPRDSTSTVTVDPGVLASAVDRVATISGDKARSAKFDFQQGVAKLTVRNMEAGQAEEEVEVDLDGDRIEIGMNARYVLDVLQRVKGGKAVFDMTDPGAPVRVTDDGNESVLFIIMPLRV